MYTQTHSHSWFVYRLDHTVWTTEQVYQWAVEKVGIDQEDAVKLKKHKLDGSMLTGLTEEKLERWGLPGGAAGNLVMAAALLWENITIHGVVLAPAVEKNSESCTVGGSSILTLCGMDARSYLGGLDQLVRHLT